MNFLDAIGAITKHSNIRKINELSSYSAFLNDKTAADLTNNQITSFIEIKIYTFEACVEMSKLNSTPNPLSNTMLEGYIVEDEKVIPVGHRNTGILSLFNIMLAGNTPYLIHRVEFTDKHEKILYDKLKLRPVGRVSDCVMELSWKK